MQITLTGITKAQVEAESLRIVRRTVPLSPEWCDRCKTVHPSRPVDLVAEGVAVLKNEIEADLMRLAQA